MIPENVPVPTTRRGAESQPSGAGDKQRGILEMLARVRQTPAGQRLPLADALELAVILWRQGPAGIGR